MKNTKMSHECSLKFLSAWSSQSIFLFNLWNIPLQELNIHKSQAFFLSPPNNLFVTKTRMRNLCLSLLGITATSWINEFCVL